MPLIKKGATVRKGTAQKTTGRVRASLRVRTRGAKKLRSAVGRKRTPLHLERFSGNPIIEPRGHNAWESKATFNPAALHDGGRVHVLYRAIGDDDMSVLGYAASADGLHFDIRSNKPAYVPVGIIKDTSERRASPPVSYCSGGGGWGGAEDPRLVKIDDRIYLTFLAFNGWNSARIALTSISAGDFQQMFWKWKKPVFISPSGEVHKNWVLFPEKVHGKFAILHGISPHIRIDYFDTLDGFEELGHIKSAPPVGGRKGKWDNWMRGAGPPPLKTKDGWLLLYHAMDTRDPDRYKLGAMLLDLKNPTQVHYRSKHPILEPDEAYENEGHKAGVIYSCGAVIIGDQLLVYYGGADMVTCVATANLATFLKALKEGRTPELKQRKSV